MDVAAIFSYVRTSLDSDSDEMPDALLGVWLNAAENRIYEAVGTSERLWSARQTLTGTGATQAFTLSTITEPRIVSGPMWELEPIQHAAALQEWPLNRTEGTPSHVGNATHYSMDDQTGKIWFWIAPSSGQTYIVTGLKTPAVTDFTTTSNTPALPQRYHSLIGEYMVARGYEMQQNSAMASLKMSRFEGELDVLQRADNRVQKSDTPVVMNGVELRKPRRRIGPRLSWPWE